MKTYHSSLGKLLLLVILVILTHILLLYFIAFQLDPDCYYAASIDKHAKLDKTSSPRIIFVGGSNCALGIDSPEIEKQLSLPVVNMGMSITIGLHYMLNEIKPSIKKGDIICIVPEYTLLFNQESADGYSLAKTLVYFPEGLKYLDSRIQYFSLMRSYASCFRLDFLKIINRKFKQNKNIVYRRSGFNLNGDLQSHLLQSSLNSVKVSGISLYVPKHMSVDKEIISSLNDFYDFVLKKEANVCLIFPVVSDFHWDANRAQLLKLENDLRKQLKISTMGSIKESIFSLDLFFDSPYHLNEKGRKINSERISKLLNTFMPNQGI